VIETDQGLAIREIFEKHGELYFRKLEHQVLKEILKTDDDAIISLGGGTPCYSNNMELFKDKNIITIYLSCSVDELFARLNFNKSKRPLIANMSDNELKEYIGKHLFERSVFYNQAQITINSNGKSREDIVGEIRNKLF
jgi:shikimate kinase